jgi:hypothetical protein
MEERMTKTDYEKSTSFNRPEPTTAPPTERPATLPPPALSREPKFIVGGQFDTFGFPWKIIAISREGILIKPVGAHLIIPGRQRDKERRRHHK